MKKNDILTIIILGIISLVCSINAFTGFLNSYTLFAFLLVMGIIDCLLIGFQKDKSIIEKDIILSLIIYLLIYYFSTYILGLFIGFVRNGYSLTFTNIIKNTLPVILLIVSIELFRYMVNVRYKQNKKLLIISCITFILVCNTLTLSDLIVSSMGISRWVEQLGLFIIPSVLTNIFLTYLTVKVGYKSSILYRLLMELPLYLIPIFPNFGNYIESVFRITIPVYFIIWLYKYLDKKKNDKIIIVGRKKRRIITRIIAFGFCFVIVYFISGYFRYKAVVIATGSMMPNIQVGDVLIIDQDENLDVSSLEVGDVIAYDSKGKIICHRIVKIIPSGQKLYFEMKGDANDDSDPLLVGEEDIIGLINVKIPYIGYPSILINRIK